MYKQVIKTTSAPAPIGPYSQAMLAGGFVFISGQICINPSTGQLNNRTIAEETKQVMENLKAILTETGLGFDKVVKSSIFLTDMNRFSEVNEVYGSYFTDNFPARETVQVSALPKFVNVEISMIAMKN